MAFVREHRVEGLGLALGARKAVQEHAPARLGFGQSHADDVDDQLVGDQVARGHYAPGLPASWAAAGHLGAQDVAGREMLEVELLFDLGGLGAFAAPRRAEDDADHKSRILRRSCHQVLACSARSAWMAGSGPAGAPSLLSASHRLVTST